MPKIRFCLSIACAAVLAGCSTPGPILSEAVGSLRSGVAASQSQSQLTFRDGNNLVLDQNIIRVLNSGTNNIGEKQFIILVSDETAAKWNNSFGILDEYAAALQKLVDPTRSQATGDALVGLGNALNGPTINANLSPGFTAAVGTFGQALVQAKAEKSATKIMAKTDPAFGQVVSEMAKAVGSKNDEILTLRHTLYDVWTNQVLTQIAAEYAVLKPNDPNKRLLLEKYVAAIKARDAQMASLGELRRSILALGEVHTAAANGRPGDAAFWVQRITSWLDDFKKRKSELEGEGQ
jgi:hypothetical protein